MPQPLKYGSLDPIHGRLPLSGGQSKGRSLRSRALLSSAAARTQAARTVSRNWLTPAFDRLLSDDSACAADNTSDEAEPVSLAPPCTSMMLDQTSLVPCEACWTLREISCVAAPYSSTAAAMVEAISESHSMVPEISLMAPTDSWGALRMPEIC